jgi:hypothetical protein
MVAAFGCSEPDNNGTIFLDVTPNNIKGVWRMESYDNGVQLAEGSYYYIVFDRAKRTFVSYDNTESMEVRKRTGRYDIYTDGAAIIFGDYDYGLGPNDWEHRYYVRNLTAESMTWIAKDNADDVTVYVRCEIPAELAGE